MGLVEKFENKLQEIINDSNLNSTDENDDKIYKELKKMGYA